MDVAVLVPVKRFGAAKGRLSAALSPEQRVELARHMAARVIAAAGEHPAFVACDDPEVRSWAEARGATPLWTPGLGLNGAIDAGVATIADRGLGYVVIAHADLPLAHHLGAVASTDTAVLVPDRRHDGTNVMSFPLDRTIAAEYGAGSFRRHLDAAIGRGLAVEVRSDAELCLDVDTPDDLTHPLLREVLAPWLPTTQDNPSSR